MAEGSKEVGGVLEEWLGRLITRTELDDGAAIIDGHLVDVRGKCRLRARYLTSYGFVIAAHGSPINNGDFDQPLMEHLRAILSGKGSIDDLAEDVRRLPKRG